MALQTFSLRLLDKIGEALAGDLGLDAGMFNDWLTEGTRKIISKMPKQLWKFFGKTPAAFAPTTGVVVESQKVIQAFRSDGTIQQPCRIIDEKLKGRATDTSEINYATATDPAAYVDFTTTATPTLKILPVSGTAVGYVTYVNFPTIAAATDTVINGFPDDLEDVVVDYALMQAKQRESSYLRKLAQGEVTGTRIEDALDKSRDYMDNLASTDFESYVTAEDVEMAQTMVGGASEEVNRANSEIQYALARASDYLKSSTSAMQDYQTMEKSIDERIKMWISVNL